MPHFSEKQAESFAARPRRWNIHVGATSSGKTYGTYSILLKRMRRQPPGNCLLIGNTLGALVRNVIEPMKEIFGPELVQGPYGRFNKVRLFGRECYTLGAHDESSYKAIQGITLAYAYGDEFPTWPRSIMEWLKSRLRVAGACFDGTGNPEGPFHWAKVDWIDRADDLDLAYWHYVLDDNPFLPPDYVESLKREYTGVWYQRLILGLWVAAEGIIYDVFDQAVNVVDEHPPIVEWWIACDYGTSNPTVFLLVGLGEDGNYYVVDEWRWDSRKRRRQKTDAEYATDLAEWIDHHDVFPQAIIVDPSAASFIAACRADGIYGVTPADNDVLGGIRRTASMFGAPKLFICSRCKGLIGEILGYVWNPKAQERGQDEPLKRDDHGPDALKYWCNHVMSGRGQSSAWT